MNIYKYIETNTSILDVVSRFTEITPDDDGALTGRCPFCGETTFRLRRRAFSSCKDIKYFHCNSCGSAGEVIEFVMMKLNMQKLEASFWLIKELELAIPFEMMVPILSDFITYYDNKIDRLAASKKDKDFTGPVEPDTGPVELDKGLLKP